MWSYRWLTPGRRNVYNLQGDTFRAGGGSHGPAGRDYLMPELRRDQTDSPRARVIVGGRGGVILVACPDCHGRHVLGRGDVEMEQRAETGELRKWLYWRLPGMSVRGLMLLILLLCCWLAWQTNGARRQQRAIAIIKKAGGHVSFDDLTDDEGRRRSDGWQRPGLAAVADGRSRRRLRTDAADPLVLLGHAPRRSVREHSTKRRGTPSPI